MDDVKATTDNVPAADIDALRAQLAKALDDLTEERHRANTLAAQVDNSVKLDDPGALAALARAFVDSSTNALETESQRVARAADLERQALATASAAAEDERRQAEYDATQESFERCHANTTRTPQGIIQTSGCI